MKEYDSLLTWETLLTINFNAFMIYVLFMNVSLISEWLALTKTFITMVICIAIIRDLLDSFLGIEEFSLAASLRSLNKRANFYSLFLSWILIYSNYFEDELFRLDYPSLSLSVRLWHAWNYNIELCLEAWTRTLTVRLSYDWIFGQEYTTFMWNYLVVLLLVIGLLLW